MRYIIYTVLLSMCSFDPVPKKIGGLDHKNWREDSQESPCFSKAIFSDGRNYGFNCILSNNEDKSQQTIDIFQNDGVYINWLVWNIYIYILSKKESNGEKPQHMYVVSRIPIKKF